MRSKKYSDHLKHTFFRYAVMLILLMFILFIGFMIANILLTTIYTNERSNKTLATFFNSQMNNLQATVEQMSTDKIIIECLTNADNETITNANRLLYDFSVSHTLRPIFVLLDRDFNITCSNLFEDNRKTFLQSAMIHNVAEKLDDNSDVFSCVSRMDYNNGQCCDFLFAKAIFQNNLPIGYLFVDVRDEYIYDYVRNLSVDKVIITDRFDNIIFITFQPLTDPIGKYPTGKFQIERTHKNTVSIDDRPYYAGYSTLAYDDIQIHTFTSVEMQIKMFIYGAVFLLIMSVILILAISFLSDIVVCKNLRSLDELVLAVLQLSEGNIAYKIQATTYDEFQTLYDAFNGMTARLEELIKKNEELAEHKRLMEVKHLKAQFNPHFVFNVMEALRYEIIINPHSASDMVVAFARLMRYSINYGDSMVPLKTDIEYVNNYLALQKLRYNKRLEYNIHIDENLMSCKVPKLLIQPIVENCLNHGANNAKFIHIEISGALCQKDVLELTVSDNGSGIEPEKLAMIQYNLDHENVDPNHIGLYNVHRALRLQFGPGFGLSIDSKPSQGTSVMLRILVEEGINNV
ncbi:sensor histidine kinase [Bacteroides sp.]|uniref:sensor histidine kinase n=1 Tax=Bacteroides sp. TaxID=29523 RepID=UPI002637C377|nr:sensor histidine kinase [Bacteroides sp.]MDD3040859.1 sensor histidine kinase [Bacteroides sp.]